MDTAERGIGIPGRAQVDSPPLSTTDNPILREDFMECGKPVIRCSVMEILPIAMLEALLSFIVVSFT